MRRKGVEFTHRLNKHGVQDIRLLVAEVKDWFSENDYTWYETKNITKDKPKGFEVEITIEGEKDVDDYFRRNISFNFLFMKVKKVKSGNKTLDFGKNEVKVDGKVTHDWQNFYHSKFGDYLMSLKEKFIMYKDIKAQTGKLYTETQELVGVIKNVLGLP